MVLSIFALLGILIIVILFAGALALGFSSGSSPTLAINGFTWTLGNGDETFLSVALDWPYVKTTSGQVAVTYSFMLPSQTPTQPNLPVIISLPSAAINLSGVVSLSSLPLPSGQSSIIVVQFGSNAIAFRYEPSGAYLIGSELTSAWSCLFEVVFTVA